MLECQRFISWRTLHILVNTSPVHNVGCGTYVDLGKRDATASRSVHPSQVISDSECQVFDETRRIKACRSTRVRHCSLSISVSHFLNETIHFIYHISYSDKTTTSSKSKDVHQNVLITAPRSARGKQLVQRATHIRYEVQKFSFQQIYANLYH